ncbi:MAG TPA: cation:proton antiporter [Gammaproteobacteria bacterium]|nr:cation:proton antiporter [Gammaproteobacteria bacterium]
MDPGSIGFTIFLVFSGAALFATLALYARQSLLVAYILLGILLGPWGLGLVNDPNLVREIAEFGIMFLLFLLGLNLQPQDLLHMVRKTTLVTVISSIAFFAVGFAVSLAFGLTPIEAVLVGGAVTFSSTIIGLKLLPTTILHHQRTGEVIISILLLQDLLAIVLLLVVQGSSSGGMPVLDLLKLLAALPALGLLAWLGERYLLLPLIQRFDRIQEYIFLMAIGWCLGMAELGRLMGLSVEIGAFVAGVTLASSPIALFIADSLRPLRDFFLVLFFFSLGAGFDLGMMEQVLMPALLLAGALLLIKPMVFRVLLRRTGESLRRSHEVGYRLGQMSEFSLLLAVLAQDRGVIGDRASYLIQLATLLTFLASSYLIVMRFPTPIAVSDRLRRD